VSVPAIRHTTVLRLEVFAARCSLHPDLVRRFVSLGLIEPVEGAGQEMVFSATQIGRVDRMVRLRSDLGLNYNALGLVVDLLERVEQLEATARSHPQE